MENDKITMTEEEILKDYPRLKLEYTRLHEEFRHLQTKQLNILGVVRSFSEIQTRINELGESIEESIIDYAKSEYETERTLIAERRVTLAKMQNELKWVIGF